MVRVSDTENEKTGVETNGATDTVTENAEDNAEDKEVLVAVEDRAGVAGLLVDKYAKWSFGAGLIPSPAIDLLALTAIQVKMLADLSNVYGLSYTDHGVRATLGSLIGGTLPQTMSTAGLSSALKSVPLLGTFAALMFMPTASAASTYAIGTVFTKHFESGGSLLNINLSAMRTDMKALAGRYRKEKADEAAEKAA